ncbi:MAG: FGGY family carbohydrate kinase [Desulfurococcaceae archaeon]
MEKNQLLVGLDIGTSSVKACVYDRLGNKHFSMRKPLHNTIYLGSIVEQDPHEVLSAVIDVLKTLANVFKNEELYVGLSSTSPSLVVADNEVNHLYKVIAWMDRRAVAEAGFLESQIGRFEIVRNTGLYCDPIFTAPKILWVRRHLADLFNRARFFIQLKDYVFYHLTMQPYTDFSHVSETLLYTLKGDFYTELLNLIDITPDYLFKPASSSSVFEINPSRLMRELQELRGRVFIALGGVDSVLANIGAGAVSSNIASDTTGTSTCLNIILKEPSEKFIGLFEIYRHAIDDYFVLEASLPTSGYFLDRVLDLLGSDHTILNKLDEKPSTLLIHPFLEGTRSPDWNPRILGSIYGLSTMVSREDLVKGVLESVAFWIRSVIDTVREGGLMINEVRSGGGGGRGIWNKIKANVTGVVYKEPLELEISSLGAAIIAGLGAGIFKDVFEAVSSMVKINQTFFPNPSLKPIYDDKYNDWLSIWSFYRKFSTTN